jgi:hypothetical protein
MCCRPRLSAHDTAAALLPLSSPFSPPCGAEPRDPPAPLFVSARATGPLKRSRLPAPHRAYPCRSPVASPPHHRKIEPPRSPHHLLDKPVLRASWLASGVHLTLSFPLRCCRTLPLAPPVTGVPPPPWDITVPPPLRPHTLSRCSGEPSPPPS